VFPLEGRFAYSCGVKEPIVDVVIPEDIVQATHLSPEELRIEIAVLPFETKRLIEDRQGT